MISGYEVSKGIGIGVAVIVPAGEYSGQNEADNAFSSFVSRISPGAVIVAENFTPVMAASLRDKNVAAIVCETGGMTSHSALVAKSFGIPAVYGATGATHIIKDGDTVIVDGLHGNVYERPDTSLIEEFSSRRKEFIKDRADLERYRGMKTVLADGGGAEVLCNVSDIIGVMSAIENGAEGIGLLRTENLFTGNKNAPTEEEQTRSYMRVARAMDGHGVVIRTLDIGGDKMLPFMKSEQETNPFLGFRAIRYSLANRDFFIPQLRAILKASAAGNVSIMIPMVTCIEEIRNVKALIHEVKSDLRDEGAEFNDDIRIGAMIETPAAAVISDLLAEECDFFSIGTNDLVQYTMCADRSNSKLTYLQAVTHPSVLRLIARTIENANAAGIPVSICGEAASEPFMIPVLAGFGCRRFSVDPLSVPEVRRTLSTWTTEKAKALADEILKIPSDGEIREYLRKNIH